MVPGLNRFREHFAGHEAHYAVIGGSACSLIFEEAGLEFRATQDIDMVLCVEVIDAAFVVALKGFLDAGGYQARERADGRREFYRFHRPANPDYPAMIELFARPPAHLPAPEEAGLTVVEVLDEMLSLSAILLDDDYYNALLLARRSVDGVHVLDERLLIPFKARAFVDLSRRRGAGDATAKGTDIRKHRNDVFRLLQLLPAGDSILVPEPLKEDLRSYVQLITEDETFDPGSFGVPLDRTAGIALLQSLYAL